MDDRCAPLLRGAAAPAVPVLLDSDLAGLHAEAAQLRHNLKELRPGSSGASEVRILFIFDPARNAVLVVAGDKSGGWQKWYAQAIPAPEATYEAYLKEQR